MAATPQTGLSTNGRVETSFQATSQPHNYSPLAVGQFRILALLPGTRDDPVQVLIKELDLEQATDAFDALSYTWAPLTPWREVQCGYGTTLSVTSNLYDALVALRSPDTLGLYWIDQICINQRDVVEKAAQVQLMGQIYARAARVRIWLSAEIWQAKEDLVHFTAFVGFCTEALTGSVEEALRDAKRNGDITDAGWQAMFRFLQSNYFRRVWMIQEIVMSKDCWVMAFDVLLLWTGLIRVAITFQHMLDGAYPVLHELYPSVTFPPDMRHRTRALQKMINLRSTLQDCESSPANQIKWTLLDLLRKTWLFEATDKRDKVYAVLGLLSFTETCHPTAIVPDYSEHSTFDSLVQSVFLESLTSYGGLECLCYCTPYAKDTTPSWMAAVDIGFNRPSEMVIHSFWDAGGMKMVDGRHQPSHVRCVSRDPLLIAFRVTHVGNLTQVLGPCAGEINVEERVRRAQHPQTYFETVGSVNGDEVMQYLEACKTLSEVTFGTASVPRAEATDLFQRAFLLDLDPSAPHAVAFTRNSHSPEYDAEELLSKSPHFLGLSNGLRFAVADSASSLQRRPLLCWVPPSSEEGDMVCVVHGYRFPMIIRRVPGPEKRYRFLGASYVQGYMDGEALTDESLEVEDAIFL